MTTLSKGNYFYNLSFQLPNWVDYQRINHSSFLEHVQHLLRTLWYTRKLDFWLKKKSFPGQKHQFLYIVNWRIFSMIQEKETLGSSLSLIFTIILAWRQKNNYLQLTFCPNRKPHVKRIDAKKPTTQDFPIFSPCNQSICPSYTIWTMTKTIANFPLE